MEPFRLTRSGCIRPLVFLLLVQALWALPALADEPKAGVVTTVQGQATVSRPIIPQPVPLKVRDDVFLRDRIDTRENSVVRVLLAGKALVTVRELSIFTITEEPGRAIVDLQVGRLAVGVAKKLLKPGESIEVRTPNAVAAIRGSFLVADVVIVGGTTQVVGGTLQIVGGTPQTTFTALQVSVPITVSPRADPTITIPLGTNQTMGVSGVGATTTLTPVQPATPQQVAQATQASQVSKPEEHVASSPAANVVVTEQVQVAAQLAEILAPAPSQTSTTTTAPTTTEPPKTTTTDLCVQCGQIETPAPPVRQPVIPTGPYFLVQNSTLQLPADSSLATFTAGPDPQTVSGRDTLSPTSGFPGGFPLVSATGANISIAGDLLTGGSHGPVLDLKDSTLAGSSAPLFDVANTHLTTSGLLAVDPSVLTLSGSLLSLNGATLTSDAPLVTGAGSTITAMGAGIPLLDVQSSTLSVTGTGNSLLSLNASTLGVNGPFLAATGASTSIEVAGPLLSLAGGSTFGGAGPFLRMTGGSLTADGLAIGTGGGNKFTLAGALGATDGLLLDLSGGAHLTLRTLLEAPDSNVVTFGPASTQPLVRMVGSTLTLTGTDPMFELAGGTLPPVVGGGSDLVSLSGGSFTSAGPLLSIVPGANVGIGGALALADGARGSFTGGTHVVSIPDGSSLTTTRPLFNLSGGSTLKTVAGGSLIFQDPSLLILNNPALTASGSAVSLSGALLNVADSNPLTLTVTSSGLLASGAGVLGTNSLATLDTGAALTFLGTSGGLLTASNSDLIFVNGFPLFKLTDSSIGDIGTPGPYGRLVYLATKSFMTVSGPTLDAAGSTVNLSGELVRLVGTSTYGGVGPFARLSGGSLRVDTLAAGAGDGSQLAIVGLPSSTEGLVLDLKNGATVTLRTLFDLPGSDALALTSNTGQPLVNLTSGSLTTTGPDHPLLQVGAMGAVNAGGDVLTLGAGSSLTLGGPLAAISGGSLTAANVLTLGADLATPAGQPLLSVTGGSLHTTGSLASLGANLTLGGTFLSQSGGSVTSDGDALAVGSHTLTSGGAAVFDLSGGALTTTGSSHLVSLAGGTLNLGGALLILTGSPTVTIGGDVLHVASAVTGPSSGSILSVGSGTLNADGALLNLGTASTLTLSDSLATISGGTVNTGNVLALGADLATPAGQPLLSVTGGSLHTTGSLASLGANLTLGGTFLSQSGGSVTTTGDAVALLGHTLTTGSAAAFDLTGGTLSAGGHLVSLGGGTLAVGAGGLLSLTAGSGTTPTVTIGGDVLHVGSTLTGPASGSLISVGAGSLTADNLLAVETTLTLPGSLLTQTGGSVNVGSALALTAVLTTTAGAPVLKVTDGELTATTLASLGAALILKDSFLTQSGGKVTTSEDALAVGAFTLDSTGTTKAVFDLSGGTLSAGGHVASVNGGILNLGGGLLNVTGTGLTSSTSLFTARDSTISAKGVGVPLARVESGTFNLTGAGNSLLSLDHSQLTLGVPNVSAGGPALESISSDITVAGALVHFQNGSSFTSTAGPLVKITGGSFSADALGTTDGLSNTIKLTGTLMDLTNTTVTLRAVGDDPVGSTDTFTHSLASAEPAFRLTGSRLKLQGAGENLVSFGVDTGPVPDQSGVALIATELATEAGIKRSRVEVAGTLLDLGGVHLTDSDPQIKLTNTDVVQTGSKSLIEVSGLPVTVDGSLLKATDSTISSEANLLLVQGTLTTGAFAAIDVNGGSVDVAGHLVSVNGGTLNLGGNLLSLTGSPSVTIGGDVLHVASSVTGPPTGSLFSFGGGTLNATGDLLDLGASSTLTLHGPLATVSGGSVGAATALDLHAPLTTPSGQPFLQVTGGSLSTTGSLATLGANLTLGGAFLSQSGGTVAAGGPLVHLTSGSTFKNTVGPVVRMTGGSLTADALGISDSTGNTFDLTGTLLDLSNAGVTLRTLGEEVPDNDKDTVKFNLGLNQPLISMAQSTLALTGSDEPLVTLGAEGAPIPTQPGVALVATGTPVSKSTISLKGSLLKLKAVDSTATDALVQAGNTTINQTGTADPLISVNPHGLTSAMTGPLASLTDTSVSTSGPFFHLKNGTLTSATASPLISIDPSDAASGANFALLDGSSTLSLKGSFLSASSSDLSSGAGQSFIAVAGGSSLATMMTADPLIALSGGNVTAGANFLHVTDPGSSVSLTGALLLANGTTIAAANNLLRLANGGALSSTTPSPDALLRFSGGSFTGGGPLNTASGGSLLRMFSQIGGPGTSLTLSRPYLAASDTSFLSKDGPAFNIADGATIASTASGPFATFIRGSATSAFSFFNLDTHTSFGSPVVTGSGAPVNVSLTGGLVRGADTTLTTQNLGAFLRLNKEVSLTQSGSSTPLVSLSGSLVFSEEEEASVVVPAILKASGNFLSMTTASALAAPVLSLSAPLLSADKATITAGDPAANAFSLLGVFDGARVESLASALPAIALDTTDVTTSGSFLSLRRSANRPDSSVVPSRMTLSGPLLQATDSTITTTSLGFKGFDGVTRSCCNFLTIGQGAQFTYQTGLTPLIQLTRTTINSGGSASTSGTQSGGFFLSLFDTDTTSGLLSPLETVAPSTFTLSGPLLSATDSKVTALSSLLLNSRSFFTANSADPLITLGASELRLGGNDPFNANSPTTALLLLAAGTTGGSNTQPVTSLKGPFLSATNTTITANSGVLGVFNGAKLTSDTSDAFVQLNHTTLSTGSVTTGGDFLNVSGRGGTTGTTASSASFKGPLLSAVNGSHITLPRDVIIGANDALITGSGPAAFVQLHDSDLTAGGLLGLFSGATLDIKGPLLSLGSTLTLGGNFATIGGGQLKLGGPILSMLSGTPTASIGGDLLNLSGTGAVTGPAGGLSLVDVAATSLTGLAIAGDLADLSGGSILTLSGPLATVSGGTVNVGNVLNLGTALTTPTAQPFLRVTGGSLHSTNSLATLGADLTLGGAFLSQSGGAVSTDGDALALGGRSLTGGSAPVFNLTGGSLTVGGSLLSGAGGTVTLGGSLLKAASGASISAGGAIDNVTLDFRSGTPGGVRIFDTLGRGGEVTGQEWKPFGIVFSSPTLGLNVGCGSGTPCLGADAASNNDFRGTLVGKFVVPNTNIPSTVSSLSIDFCCERNFPPGSTTTLFGSGGNTLAVLRGDVPTQNNLIGSFSIQFAFDAIWKLIYDGRGGGSGAPLLLLGDGTRLTGTSTDPLILLSDRSGLSLGGRQLLKATSSVLTVAGDLLGVTGGSTLSSGASGALLELNGTALTAGTTGANTHLLHLSDVGSQVSLGGGLLSANGGSVTVKGDDVIEIRGGAALTASGTAPLIELTNSPLMTSGSGCSGCPRSLLHLFGTSGSDRSTLSLAGSLLKTTNSNISVPVDSDLLTIASGAKLTTAAATPLLDITGGTHSIGKSVLKLDAALLEASAPLLKLTNSASTMTVGGDLARLTGSASFGPSGSASLLPGDALVMLNASKLIVNGSLFNLTGSSSLSVKGDLLYLGGGSLLTLTGGGILNLSGSPSAIISGALIAFGTGTNTVSISNSFCNSSCAFYPTSSGDIRVAVGTHGTPTINFPTDPSKLVKGTGTISYQSSSSAAILLSGTSTLTVQGKP